MVNEFDVENPDKEELKKIYNDKNRYPWTYGQLEVYEDYCDRYRMHAIMQEVEKFGPSTILDNGCGSALISRSLAKKGYHVTGLDFSDALLNLVPKTDNLSLVVGDSDKLAFEDNSFDCVICSEVLEHIKENSSAIKEISRILDKDGYAIITVPNWGCYDSLEGNFKFVTTALNILNYFLKRISKKPIFEFGVNMHFHKMFPWQWKAVLVSNGLEVVRDRAVFITPYFPMIKYLERLIYRIPGLFALKTAVDDIISPIPPFKYLGLSHMFVCRKKPIS